MVIAFLMASDFDGIFSFSVFLNQRIFCQLFADGMLCCIGIFILNKFEHLLSAHTENVVLIIIKETNRIFFILLGLTTVQTFFEFEKIVFAFGTMRDRVR